MPVCAFAGMNAYSTGTYDLETVRGHCVFGPQLHEASREARKGWNEAKHDAHAKDQK